MFSFLTVGSKADNFAVWKQACSYCVSLLLCMHVCMDTNTVVLAYNNVYGYAHNICMYVCLYTCLGYACDHCECTLA